MVCAEGPAEALVDGDFPRSGDATRRLKEVCHDARQELALIMALAEGVQASAGLSHEHRGQITTLMRVTGDLANTLRDAVTQASTRQRVDMSALVRDVGHQAGILTGSQVTVIVDDDLTLDCDPMQARRGLLNLLDNATRAAGPDGCVRLRAARTDRGLVIEVDDSGPGFGAAAPGLASIGLTVVRDWITSAGGLLYIRNGGLGGASLQLVFSVPHMTVARTAQLSR
jgi:signal transduction histidine kinase